MELTNKVCTGILMGSFVSWFVWILVETFIGKGFLYNSPGLIFGLTLTLLAVIVYTLYLKMKKTNYIYILLCTGCLLSITLYIYSYFFMHSTH